MFILNQFWFFVVLLPSLGCIIHFYSHWNLKLYNAAGICCSKKRRVELAVSEGGSDWPTFIWLIFCCCIQPLHKNRHFPVISDKFSSLSNVQLFLNLVYIQSTWRLLFHTSSLKHSIHPMYWNEQDMLINTHNLQLQFWP